MVKRKWLVLLAIITLTAFIIYGTSTILADTITVVVGGGSLSMSSGGNQTIGAVTLDGTDKTSTGSMGTLSVTDARGSGAGWNVTTSATDFFKSGDPSKTISKSGFIVPSIPGVSTISGNTAPTSFSGNLGTGFKLLSAALNQGMGSYETSPSLELAIPAETFIGTYDSTLTVTVTSGP